MRGDTGAPGLPRGGVLYYFYRLFELNALARASRRRLFLVFFSFEVICGIRAADFNLEPLPGWAAARTGLGCTVFAYD